MALFEARSAASIASFQEGWQVLVGSHRAIGVEVPDGVLWFWIGTHSEYDSLACLLTLGHTSVLPPRANRLLRQPRQLPELPRPQALAQRRHLPYLRLSERDFLGESAALEVQVQ